MPDPILQVEDLRVQFQTEAGLVTAVDGVSFALAPGETLGMVGESGSGKSVTNLAILGLVPRPAGRVIGGRVTFQGRNLLQQSEREWGRIRGNRIAMIFQDPMTALNPFLTIAEQLTEVTRLHLGLSHRDATRHAIGMLEQVGIPAASRRLNDYPHQFSGGMRQRVMIAIALSCRPDVLIADEPTTALDVTIQAQILDLMKQLQREHGTAIVFVTHDLGVVATICHRVLVMYAGKVVEQADSMSLFAQPRHPYTLGLLGSVPRWDRDMGGPLRTIPGQPPDLAHLPNGCPFAPRCSFKEVRCDCEMPQLDRRPGGGTLACFANVILDQGRGITG